MKIVLSIIFNLICFYSISQKPEVILQDGHTLPASFDISPDGKKVISGGWDNTVKLWDVRMGRQYATLREHKGFVHSVLFDSTGKLAVSASMDMSLVIWDVENEKVFRKILTGAENHTAIFINGTDWIASGGDDSLIQVWNYITGEKIASLKGHKAWINSIDQYQKDDSKFLISTSGDSMIIGWNLDSMKIRESNKFPFELKHINFSKSSPYFFITDENNYCYLYSNTTGNSVATFKLTDQRNNYSSEEFYRYFGQPAFSPDGENLVFMDSLDNLQFYNIEKDKMVGYAIHDKIVNIRFDRSGNLLLIGMDDGKFNIIDLSNVNLFSDKKSETTFGYTIFKGKGDPVSNISFNKDGDKILVSGFSLSTFNLKNGETFSNDYYVNTAINNTVFMNRSDRIIALSGYGVQQMLLFIKDEKLADYKILDLPEKINFHSLAISKNDSLVAVFSKSGQIYIYEVKSFKLVKSLEVKLSGNEKLLSICISPLNNDIGFSTSSGKVGILSYRNEKIRLTDGHKDAVEVVTYSPDGKYLVSAGGRIGIWSSKKGKLIKVLSGHKASVINLKFNPDGKKMISCGADNLFIEWNMDKLEPITIDSNNHSFITAASYSSFNQSKIVSCSDGKIGYYDSLNHLKGTFYNLEKNGLVFFDTENNYIATRSQSSAFTFKANKKLYPLEQFDLLYNRPDKVLSVFGFLTEEEKLFRELVYEKRIKRSGYDPQMMLRFDELPQLKLLNEDHLATTSKQDSLLLHVEATDKNAIKEIVFYINDVPVHYEMNPGGGKLLNSKVNIHLDMGSNKIEIIAYNIDGLESLRKSFSIYRIGDFEKPDLYIAAVGTSDYDQQGFDLNYPAKDAKDLIGFFETDTTIFNSIHSKILVDEKVTKENFKQLNLFFSDAEINDVVILFIAGHGLLDDSLEYFYATHDMDFTQPGLKGVNYKDIEAILAGTAALRRILLMDTCHSGELDKEEVIKSKEETVEIASVKFRSSGATLKNKAGYQASIMAKEIFTDLKKGTGATVLSSSAGVEFAMESDEWKNGLFTYCLIKGIKQKEADYTKDGLITIAEWFRFTTEEVTRLSNGKQVPSNRFKNENYNFYVR